MIGYARVESHPATMRERLRNCGPFCAPNWDRASIPVRARFLGIVKWRPVRTALSVSPLCAAS